jgi:hypothetical protein
MEETTCFHLKFGGKISYFDCHRCFLPLDHEFRLDNDTFKKGNDVMHQERNVGESILSTCMSFVDKTKDNHKARKDLALISNRPSLELKSHGGKLGAPFCLKARDRKEVLIWLKNLKFPNGYAAGFWRVINLDTGKLSGVKSHDYHIFM